MGHKSSHCEISFLTFCFINNGFLGELLAWAAWLVIFPGVWPCSLFTLGDAGVGLELDVVLTFFCEYVVFNFPGLGDSSCSSWGGRLLWNVVFHPSSLGGLSLALDVVVLLSGLSTR